jgi:hypothetical protein
MSQQRTRIAVTDMLRGLAMTVMLFDHSRGDGLFAHADHRSDGRQCVVGVRVGRRAGTTLNHVEKKMLVEPAGTNIGPVHASTIALVMRSGRTPAMQPGWLP